MSRSTPRSAIGWRARSRWCSLQHGRRRPARPARWPAGSSRARRRRPGLRPGRHRGPVRLHRRRRRLRPVEIPASPTPARRPRAVAALRRALADAAVDVVHAHGLRAGLVAVLARPAAAARGHLAQRGARRRPARRGSPGWPSGSSPGPPGWRWAPPPTWWSGPPRWARADARLGSGRRAGAARAAPPPRRRPRRVRRRAATSR